MSRRLVSYSDLNEDVPPSPAAGEAGPSSHRLHGGNAGGKRKRNAADAHTKGGKRGGMRREMVHWDDPDYVSGLGRGLEGGKGGYRAEVQDGGDADAAVRGEEDESWEGALADADRHSSNGVAQPYTGRKYDEWGEPYIADSSHVTHQDLEDDSLYTGDYDDDEQENDHDQDDSFQDAPLPFAIPDVTEYHRLHPSSTTIPPSADYTTPHRPPHAVGGGGRTLTHPEIWGPSTLIQAFNAALSQYCLLHNLPPPSPAVESALWTEAPAHDSLLAQQVREDVQQILAQRRPASNPGVEGADERVGKSRKKKGKGNSEQGQQQQQRRKVVTIVPHAEVEGNSAWKKAVKTVQTTPNRIGDVVNKLLPDGNGTEASVDKVDKQKEEEGKRQKQLHAWWYAGYQAGMAAVSDGKPAAVDGGEKSGDNDVADSVAAPTIATPST